ncbi:glycosyltransferase family 2 protein [Micromonospora fluostatini]|uniref:glycosyltransferase family 2 protein n=1 Tax=Micromonospora sp. JCM 30529 TaxID=3421643 RepID=UPI003D16E0C1
MTSPPLVSVVTLTRDRPRQLRRAMASVVAQRGVRVEHIVLGDDCPYLGDPAAGESLRRQFPAAVLRVVHGSADDGEYLPARLARLRNEGIGLASGEYVAQLDDDNAYHPEHLRSLVDALAAEPGAQVAHSWRRLLTEDGRPFVPDGEDPWHPDPQQRAESYRQLVGWGVLEPGSNVVRDTLRAAGIPITRVDTSEYLVRRDLHARIPFPTRYPSWRRRRGYTEDLAFSIELVRQGVPVTCSQRATLDYYMGGYSNADAGSVRQVTGPDDAGATDEREGLVR